jgi:FkbM family methyltransferase
MTAARRFDDLLSASRVVVFGASIARHGPIGFLLARWARISALADNNAALHGTHVDGLPVLSAAEAAAQLGPNDAIVIASAYQVDIFAQLVDTLGVKERQVFPYVDELVFAACTPESVSTARDELARVREWLADESSRVYFDSLLAFRSHLDPRLLRANPEVNRQYSYRSIALPARGDVILDGGASDGVTTASFLHRTGGDCRVICVEALPSNVIRLREKLGADIERGAVKVVSAALAAAVGELFLEDSHAAGTNKLARIVGQGETGDRAASLVRVPAVTIDILCEDGLDFLKLDIEGSEQSALEGGWETLTRHAPAVAVSSYHRPQDIWLLPSMIKKAIPSARVYATHHPLCLHEIEYLLVPEERT